jgi:hypothetical protein
LPRQGSKMGLIIDTPINIKEHAYALKRVNVDAVIRYECRPPGGGWKRWQPDEIKTMADAGLNLGIVYEGAGDHAGYFSYSSGYSDASYARERCEARGQPDGSAIYFAVDFDASEAVLQNNIIPYFTGVSRAFEGAGPKQRIGCYGSGMVTNYLKTHTLIDLRWITCSLGFNGSHDAVRYKAYELWQTKCKTYLLGIDIDFDVANVDDWGQFRPFAAKPAPQPAEAIPSLFTAPVPPPGGWTVPAAGVRPPPSIVRWAVRNDGTLYDPAAQYALDGTKIVPVAPNAPAASATLYKGIVATVFGGAGDEQDTAYIDVGKGWPDRPGVALPYHFHGHRPKVKVWHGVDSVTCDIVDVGPWNTNDPYWDLGGRPQAASGRDKSGRRTNRAGIDLTPAAAKALHLDGMGVVDWEFA